MVEVVRGDDPVNAVNRSDSPSTAIPLVDLSWVDPKVVEISSTYDTEVSVTKFLAKYPVLKAGEDSRDSTDREDLSCGQCGSHPSSSEHVGVPLGVSPVV